MPDRIYLDANATTRVDSRVADAIEPYLREGYGNPSSSHPEGRQAAAAVAKARGQVAALLGCAPDEVVFTGGGSEADNLALKGVAWATRSKGRHLVVSTVEHPAVSEPARFLEREGWQVTALPVDRYGQVSAAQVAAALRDDTVLVSIMHANNETGTVNDIAAIAAVCRARGVLFHTDAAQSAGKLPIDVKDLGVGLLAVAGHKLYAPKGIGALYVRSGVVLEPLIHGAGHEGGRRAGTENVPFIAGLGAACELARTEGLANFAQKVRPLRDRLHELLLSAVPDLILNGHPEARLPNTLNVSVPGLLGRDILAACPEVSASTGSACHEGVDRPSPVLAAMGVSSEVALGALRLSLSLSTTREDVDRAAEAIVAAVSRLRQP
ncbi:MAG: cysteine desulfurase [Thermoleophilia bacterium]|nr:cysteine desulfurase [Thermoleophilia bacterium]